MASRQIIDWVIKRVNRCRTAVAVTSIASARSETLKGPAMRIKSNRSASELGASTLIVSPFSNLAVPSG
jgi:hypothetical protein